MDPRQLENFANVNEELPKYNSQDSAHLESETLGQKRVKICDACEHKTKIFFFDACGVCKCALHMKVKFKTATCPEGKWEGITE